MRAIVIGAGFGGLALAIRLQSAGVETTIVEARDKPGGRAYVWQRDGFTFDAGPTVITDPACLAELWALSGQDMAKDVVLEPGFCAFVQSACAAYLARPQASIVQMSGFAEVQMTPYTSAQSQLTTDIPTKTQL